MSKSAAKELVLMAGVAHSLNAVCHLWEPQLVENERGGVMVVITVTPNVRGHLGYWRGAWLWRADEVDGEGRARLSRVSWKLRWRSPA